MSLKDTDKLITYCQENRTLPVPRLKEDLHLHASIRTINDKLVEKGYKSYKAPQKFLLSDNQIRDRLEFASSHLHWKVIRHWSRIEFSDESVFSFVNPSGRVLTRRRADEALEPDTIQPYSAFSKSILIWGAISYDDGVGPLAKLDSTMGAEEYLQIIRYRIGRYYPDLYNHKKIYQQDNATPHTSDLVKDWFEEKDIRIFNWPSASPDINIMEDVWNLIKFKVKGIVYKNVDELWKDLTKIWRSITLEEIRNLYESLPRRIEALYNSHGEHTKY